jgi:hypothetical protein
MKNAMFWDVTPRGSEGNKDGYGSRIWEQKERCISAKSSWLTASRVGERVIE